MKQHQKESLYDLMDEADNVYEHSTGTNAERIKYQVTLNLLYIVLRLLQRDAKTIDAKGLRKALQGLACSVAAIECLQASE